MKVHHLNCVSTCPRGGRWVDGSNASLFQRARLASHCLLVETDRGLVLVDTGLGLRDVHAARDRLGALYRHLLAPELREEMTAIRQIERMGFDPADVRHIVLTQLDCDHAGGLDDFPQARVHLMTRERQHAERQCSWLDRQRYRPQQWSARGCWHTYEGASGERWLGFDCVRALEGLPPDILLVPLPGPSAGHAGVAVRDGGRWQLHAGDAYLHHAEMDPLRPHSTPGLRLLQLMLQRDRAARRASQQRLQTLRHEHAGDVDIFCSHDVQEFERLSGRSSRVPADRLAAFAPQRSAGARRATAAQPASSFSGTATRGAGLDERTGPPPRPH